MAGTRLWISAIILAELMIMALLSLYYGLCVLNDDILCHALDGNSRHKLGSLRPLPRPSWWSTTFNIHLIVEQEESSSSSPSENRLYLWSQLLEEWMKTSELEDLPYFGHSRIHMGVVPKSSDNKQLWKTTNNRTTIVETSTIWTYLPERLSDGSSEDEKHLDWLIYIPANKEDLTNQLVEEGDEIPSWSTWKRGSTQLVTVSTGSTTTTTTTTTTDDEQAADMTSLWTLFVGPWLETTLGHDDDSINGSGGGMSENDHLRQLQFTWHKTIMQDFDDWKRYLTRGERREVLLNLGKTSSASLSTRLESLLEARSIILQAAVERNQSNSSILTPEFPLEHYAAVFLPLLFPLLMPFMATFVKELKRFKKKVKKKHEKAKKASTIGEEKVTDAKVSED